MRLLSWEGGLPAGSGDLTGMGKLPRSPSSPLRRCPCPSHLLGARLCGSQAPRAPLPPLPSPPACCRICTNPKGLVINSKTGVKDGPLTSGLLTPTRGETEAQGGQPGRQVEGGQFLPVLHRP